MDPPTPLGCLYLLLGRQSKSLMVRRDWESLIQLWPAVVATRHSEKPSIIQLMNAISDAVLYHMELFAIHQTVGTRNQGLTSSDVRYVRYVMN